MEDKELYKEQLEQILGGAPKEVAEEKAKENEDLFREGQVDNFYQEENKEEQKTR